MAAHYIPFIRIKGGRLIQDCLWNTKLTNVVEESGILKVFFIYSALKAGRQILVNQK